MQITSENAAENVIQITSVIVQRIMQITHGMVHRICSRNIKWRRTRGRKNLHVLW
jgi:hypothetical protein